MSAADISDERPKLMLRTLLAGVALFGLIACQPAAQKPAEAPAPAPAPAAKMGLALEENDSELVDYVGADDLSFRIYCTLDSKQLMVQAKRAQFAKEVVGDKGEFIVSGQSFPETALVPSDPNEMVALALELTPDMLKALSQTSTARLAVGDSFGETASDTAGLFKTFAAKCSELSKVQMAP